MNIYSYEQALLNSIQYFNGDELAAKVFLDKYALRDNEGNLLEDTPEKMHRRMAKEFARVARKKYGNDAYKEDEIFLMFDRFRFIVPQGSPMFGIGNDYQVVSLSNCFVLDTPEDHYSSILDTDKQLVNISKRRGGVGIDLSKLRPNGSPTKNAAKTSTGIVTWMERYSNSIREVGQSGRRGALMLTLSIHHPDIESFVTIKNDPTKVTGANISVRLTKEFIEAVKANQDFELKFPVDYKERGIPPQVSKFVSAKKLWDLIIHSAWLRAEPGLLMWDNVTQNTPADCYDLYHSVSTNPCAEISLHNLDACRLMCLNLYSYVVDPFSSKARFDYDLFCEHSLLAERLMDDLVDLESEKIDKILNKIKSDPESDKIKSHELEMWQRIQKINNEGRRTGLGITAMGDCLAALGIKYGSKESIEVVGKIYQSLKLSSYEASVFMAEKLGAFVGFDIEKEKDCPFIQRIRNERPELYERMAKYGRRNVALLTTAPTGSVSILTQTTSGIEPMFMTSFIRRKKVNPNDKNVRVDFVDQNGDKWQEFTVYPQKVSDWMKISGETDISKSPWYGCCAEDIDWISRVELQAEAQKHVCHAISSTINLPESVSTDVVSKIYQTAFESGCKGITVYRNNCRSGVLIEADKKKGNDIVYTDAPKREKSLEARVHHVTVNKSPYYVVVGLLNGKPYEVFTGVNFHDDGLVVPKVIKDGELIKEKRGHYVLKNGEFNVVLTNGHSDANADALSRMTSCALRHGSRVEFVVEQLEKTFGDLTCFAKALGRTLKHYISDGAKVSGETCPQCGSSNIVRKEGCKTCSDCGWSKCG